MAFSKVCMFSLVFISDSVLKIVAFNVPVEGLKYSFVELASAVWLLPIAGTKTG
jgi:hypothetical protein